MQLQQQQQPEPSSPDGARSGRCRCRRRRLQLPRVGATTLAAAFLGLVAFGRLSSPASSSARWIGAGVSIAEAAPIIAAAAHAATAVGRGGSAHPFGLAFVGAPAGGRSNKGAGAARRRSAADRGARGLTVCWDSGGGDGAGQQRGAGGRFAPFKTGTIARLVRPTAVATPAPAEVQPATVAAPAQASTGFSAGMKQIWDAVQGKNGEDGTGGSGGGSNTVFKVLLATVACVYGTNFGAIKYLDEANVDVSIVTAIRFALASGALAPFLFKAPRHILERGLEVGVWVAFGYLTQAIGLQDTQASKSAFICSLSVVVVPIVNAIVYKKRPPPTTWLASILAVIGVGMLTLEGDLTPSVGDLWSLGQPLGFGVAFVRTEQCMSENKDQALAMTAAQMLGVFMCAFAWVSFTLTAKTPDLTVLWEPANIAALVYTGLITSAFSVVMESIALAHVTAEETTVILSTEPLWAALFGAAVLGERLDALGYFGGLIILAGCLLSQAKLPPAVQSKLEAVFGPGDSMEEG